jgi:hypothetical protein
MKSLLISIFIVTFSALGFSQTDEQVKNHSNNKLLTENNTSYFRLQLLGIKISKEEREFLDQSWGNHRVKPYIDINWPPTTNDHIKKNFLSSENFPWPTMASFAQKKVLTIGEGNGPLFSFLYKHGNINRLMSVAVDFDEGDIYPKKNDSSQCQSQEKENRLWSDVTEFADGALKSEEGTPYICLKPFIGNMDYVLGVATLCCIFEAAGEDGLYKAIQQVLIFLHTGGQAHLTFHHNIPLETWPIVLEKIIKEFPSVKFNLSYKNQSPEYKLDGTMGEFGLLSLIK